MLYKLEDIITVGYCDREDGSLEYTADTSTLYLEFADFLLRLDATEGCSKLRLCKKKEIEFDLAYVEEEEFEYAFSRMHNLLFQQGEMDDVCVEKAVFYNLQKEADCLLCSALKLELSSGQILFFDPAYYFGIKVGDEKLFSIWEWDWREREYTATTWVKAKE